MTDSREGVHDEDVTVPNGVEGASHHFSAEALTPMTGSNADSPADVPTAAIVASQVLTNISKAEATSNTTPPASSQTSKKRNFKILYDPDLAPKGAPKSKNPVYRFNGESTSREITVVDPRQSVNDYVRSASKGKQTYLKALKLPMFQYDKHSVGPEPPTQIFISGISTLTTSDVVNLHFRPFGDIQDLEIKVDPNTGASLGMGMIKYRKMVANKMSGHIAARKAVEKGNGMKIGLTKVTVEFDHDGSKCRRASEAVILRRKESLPPLPPKPQPQKEISRPPAKAFPEERFESKAELEAVPSPARNASPPFKPPSAPLAQRIKAQWNNPHYHSQSPSYESQSRRVRAGTREDVRASIMEQIGNDPYIFIPDNSLPTKYFRSSDLQRRLHKDDWRTVFSDRTGFYIVFKSFRAAQVCFDNNDMTRFGTYMMSMIMHEPRQSLKTKNVVLSPATEATNSIIKQLKEVFIKDIKSRIAAPRLYEFLDPNRFGTSDAQTEQAKSSPSEKTNEGEQLPNVEPDVKKLPLLPRFKRRPADKTFGGKHARPMHQMLNVYHSDESDLGEDDHASDADESDDNRSPSMSVAPDLAANILKNDQKKPRAPTDRENISSAEDGLANDLGVKSGSNRLQKSALVQVSRPQRDEIDFTSSEEDSDVVAEQALLQTLMEPLPALTESEDNVSDFEKPKRKITKVKRKTMDAKVEHEIHEETPEEVEMLPSTLSLPVEEESDILLDLDGIQSLVKDSEDFEFLKTSLDASKAIDIGSPAFWAWKQKQVKAINLEGIKGVVKIPTDDTYFRPNPTGAARSEGFFTIPESEKSEYLPHRKKITLPAGVKTSSRLTSRGNRVTNRRFAADLKLQKAMLGSEADVLRFNQLKKRKKPVRFARSHIHGWGLFANDRIDANDMIIEYVGEMIRQQVADRREKVYMNKGIGSSYLFRIDESTVIDATKKGKCKMAHVTNK